ncbi:MAG TPA: calcium-binding protein, partial [Clostridia bacterium]
GGAGTDYLEGNNGNDTYIFGLGDGIDTIYDSDTTANNVDTLSFKEGITADKVAVKRNGRNLELSIKDTTDKVIIKDYFSPYYSNDYYYDSNNNVNKVEQIKFSDGTVWDIAKIKTMTATAFEGTDGNDTIYGYNDGYSNPDETFKGNAGDDKIHGYGGNDTIDGGAGNDSLYGGAGNDSLAGGAGTDYLEGNNGNDTYIFGLGDGVDTIYDSDTTAGNVDVLSFKEGITADSVVAKRNGRNLELGIKDTADKVVIKDYFSPYYSNDYYYDSNNNVNKVENIKFADGTVWDVAAVRSKVAGNIEGTDSNDTIYGFNDGYSNYNETLKGFAGNDTIYGYDGDDNLDGGIGDDKLFGGSGNDTLTGGAGNDYMEGNAGNDAYVLNQGFGQDTIYDYDSTTGNKDSVIFGDDLLKLVFSREGNNLKVSVNGTTDSITINSWASGTAYQIEEFKASDGSTLKNTQVDQLIQAMASFTQQNGMSWNEAIQEKPQETQNIVSQFWVHQSV